MHAANGTVDFIDRKNPGLKLARTITVGFPDKLDNAAKCAAEFIQQLKRDRTGRDWVDDDEDANAGAGAGASADADVDNN